MAVSFVSLLFSMKCFWKTSAAPPAPIVVTAPQYSHTTSARPADGFIGPPHELHLKFCGIGGGGGARGGGVGVFGWATRAPPPGGAGWGGRARGTAPFLSAPQVDETHPSPRLTPAR